MLKQQKCEVLQYETNTERDTIINNDKNCYSTYSK